jgi:hypothetical protein
VLNFTKYTRGTIFRIVPREDVLGTSVCRCKARLGTQSFVPRQRTIARHAILLERCAQGTEGLGACTRVGRGRAYVASGSVVAAEGGGYGDALRTSRWICSLRDVPKRDIAKS